MSDHIITLALLVGSVGLALGWVLGNLARGGGE